MADLFKYVQAQDFYLNGSGCSATDTTISLVSFKLPSGVNIAMSDFGSVGCITLEPNTSREENITFTGVTQNADGSATLTGVTRGLKFVDPYDQDITLRQPHSGGAKAVISNNVQFYNNLSSKSNDETVTGVWTFTQFPQKSGPTTPTAANELATKGYVDLVAGGISVTNQVLINGTAGENLTAGNLVYFKESDQRWWKTDATSAATVQGVQLAIVQSTVTTGNTANFLLSGQDSNQSSLTPGSKYYASNTPGAIASSAGTVNVFVGNAISATIIMVNFRREDMPTALQKAALVGSSGTPSSTNQYLTENDTTNGATITASTISFTASTKTIADSANGFVTAGFRAGNSIVVTGSASNNNTFTIVSVAAGAIVVAETLIDESAGASDTITTVKANKLIRFKSDSKYPTASGANITNLQTSNVEGVLTNGNDAGALHYHAIKILQSTRYLDTASGTVTIAHGLGRVPKYVRVSTTMAYTTGSYGGPSCSIGFSDGTNNYSVGFLAYYNGSQMSSESVASSSRCIEIKYYNAGYNGQGATITFDATNINIIWTKIGGAAFIGAMVQLEVF